MQKDLFIIRHGQTDLNKEGIVQGRGINSDLNEIGKEQASRFFEQYKSIPFDKIYTSELKRTWQTVQGFINLGIPWEKLEGLDEMAWGIYEGKPADETRDGFKKLLEKWSLGDYNAHLQGGESPLDVQNRQKKAMNHILSRTEEKTVLICMHGRAIRILLCLLTGTELKDMDSFPHQNLSLYRLIWDGKQYSLEEFNNTQHLKENTLNT